MITIHLLTKNNELTINRCLDSIRDVAETIVIGDFGSTDQTVRIAKQYGAIIVPLQWKDNLSRSHHELLNHSPDGWQFYLEPWEEVIAGIENLQTTEGSVYKLYHIQGDLLLKETRLWKKGECEFKRPIYESLEPEASQFVNCYIRGIPPDTTNRDRKILEAWAIKNPTAADTHYYKSCCCLLSKDYLGFMREANTFLFLQPHSVPSMLTRYYMAQVLIKVYKKHSEGISHLIHCLAQEPTMAEFWCLLGDAFFLLEQYHRASAFYDNAKIFGSRRKYNDSYPVEIPKYKTYPDQMLEKCHSGR